MRPESHGHRPLTVLAVIRTVLPDKGNLPGARENDCHPVAMGADYDVSFL